MSRDSTVLIIDDDEDIRETLSSALEAAGHAVASVGSGLDALRWIESHGAPSLILLDLMMPRMDGEEFLCALRKNPAFPEAHVVIMSGHVSGREKMRELGVNACLVKPFDLDELERTVSRFAR
jgi:CheY-like chemotaxis protein